MKQTAALRGVISLGLFLGTWQLGALFLGNPLLLPGPAAVFLTLGRSFREPLFWHSLGGTFLRGLSAFTLAALGGVAVGSLVGRFRWAALLFAPWMAAVKSTPVLSVILLAIIWFKTPQVPIFVALLVCFPLVAGNTREGVSQVDPSLKEMARLFRVNPISRFWRLSLPSALPYILAGFSTALGITWKAVVAAEVLAMPRNGIGTAMNIARSQLETTEVFAWTAAAVLLGAGTEGLFILLRRHLFPGRTHE